MYRKARSPVHTTYSYLVRLDLLGRPVLVDLSDELVVDLSVGLVPHEVLVALRKIKKMLK